jgi:dTDP-4-amino-4,6-dideoxygalactose transaminase
MKHNPYKIVQMFEEEVAEYTGAPYAVSVDSCTNALFLCCKYLNVSDVEIPKKTYISVAQSIMHAGGKVSLRDSDWQGVYQLKPYPIYDAAKRFTSSMYQPNTFMCLSFHIKKHLKIGKGGMVLTDNIEAAKWLKKARYEGRNEVPYQEDDISTLGWNMYMTPVEAATGLMLMQNMPQHNEDLKESYPDLSKFSLFK